VRSDTALRLPRGCVLVRTLSAKCALCLLCPCVAAVRPRYYLLRDGPHGGKDVGFSEANLISRCNTDLANTLGNLLVRAMAPKMCPGQVWPPRRQPAAGDEVADPCGGGASAAAAAATSADRESDAQADEREAALRATIAALPGEVDRAVREGRVGVGVAGVMGLLQLANAHFQASEPWKVPPAPPPSEEMVREGGGGRASPRERAIWSALEALRISLILLQHVVRPSSSAPPLWCHRIRAISAAASAAVAAAAAAHVSLYHCRVQVPESAAAGLDMLGIPDTVKERGVDALVFGYGSEGVRSFGEPVALFTKLEKMDKGADSPD
jgi:hypothetical protein